MLRCLPGSFLLAHKRALFPNGQKRFKGRANILPHGPSKILTLREVFVGLPSGRKTTYVCAVPAVSETASSLRVPEKSRFAIWSWRRDLNPRPSDYKSDALPAELRQHKPPVTGHKVNKLAQRQSACNTSCPLPCQGKRNLRGTAPHLF